ncbi:hypothetical protein Sfum_1063 [Syntrophobacter fumaroxidans MPOB]|uniref:Uncharacterized protein n=2 Tax=Syntrophobacter TaxID=29526 RepID=A0LH55_SYNFM|nr:hypothetical protein Sfum_1063 [Syntrophobacter fumaroxidans MPOB]
MTKTERPMMKINEMMMKDLLRSASFKHRPEKRLVQTHIIVCPFCENGHPVPTDFDSIHRCNCGACYKVCGNHSLENSVGDIADELWSAEELDFVRSIPVDFCNIVIEKDFDRLLDLKHTSDFNGIERFCKYDVNLHLSLVWVKRLF